MKGMIHNNGSLEIDGAQNLKRRFVRCPNYDDRNCGDWCGLFGEPNTAANGKTTLPLCSRSLEFDEFEDQRFEVWEKHGITPWHEFDEGDQKTWPDDVKYNIYLVWMGGYYEICKWDKDAHIWKHRDLGERHNITHFMPLPPSPPGELRWNQGKGWSDAGLES